MNTDAQPLDFSSLRNPQTGLAAFASASGLTYTEKQPYEGGEPADLFKEGVRREIRNCLQGDLRGLPYRLFEYHYVASRSYQDNKVMAISLPNSYPQIAFISNQVPYAAEHLSAVGVFNQQQKVVASETKFGYGYTILAPVKFHDAVSQLLTPDVLEMIQRITAQCTIEIVDNRLYLYWPSIQWQAEQYQEAYEAATALIDHLIPKLQAANMQVTPVLDSQKNPDNYLQFATSYRAVVYAGLIAFFLLLVLIVVVGIMSTATR